MTLRGASARGWSAGRRLLSAPPRATPPPASATLASVFSRREVVLASAFGMGTGLLAPHRRALSSLRGGGGRSEGTARAEAATMETGKPVAPISLGGPPLPSMPLGHRYGDPAAPVQVDVHLDFTCPFSKKMFITLHEQVIPYLNEKHPGKVLITEFNQVQPWHPASTLVHEAALAVEMLKGGSAAAYERFAKAVFDNQQEFMDDVLYEKSRKEVYSRLCGLAVECGAIDPDEEGKMMSLLTVKELDKPYEERKEHNGGNAITGLLKLYIKQSRKAGLHVSPTVYVNGLEDGGVSSGFSKEQWIEHLSPLL